MNDFIQLPLEAAEHDVGVVFDRTGETFCVSYGMQDEIKAKADAITLWGNVFGPMRTVLSAWQALVDENEDLRAVLEGLEHDAGKHLLHMTQEALELAAGRTPPSVPLEKVDAGDWVVRWHYSTGEHYRLDRVTRTTKSLILLGQDKFWRRDGRLVGGFWTSDKIKPVSKEMLEEIGART